MNGIPMEHGLLLAAVLFCIGLCGLLIRRNLLYILMSIEIMMNASALAFVVAGSRWAQADGQIAQAWPVVLGQLHHQRAHRAARSELLEQPGHTQRGRP